MRTSQEVEDICKKLKPIIGDKADNLWYMYLAEDFKGRKDLVLDIEIYAEKVLKRAALAKQEILLEPPSQNNSTGSFLLGDIIYNDKKLHPLYLRSEDFIKQIGIFAITGEGKTNLAYHLALQLLKSKTPFIVIDWKRSWRNLLSLKDKIPELKQVKVYTVGREILPFLWNPFRQPPDADKQLWISNISETLEKSHISGPGVAYHFNHIYSKLLRNMGNHKNFYPNFHDGLNELERIKTTFRELKWKQTAQRILQSFTLGNISKTFNARNPIKLEQLLNKPVILELDLEMPKPLRIFFSEMILKWIHLYRLSQGETENLRHVLFLEEAHNLFNDNILYKQGTSSIENIYREIRVFGQGIVSITQHPSLLPIYLLGNCHTQIYLGLQHADDIRTARKALFMKPDEEAYPNMLKVGECITKIKNRIEPCLVRTPLVPVRKGLVNDDWLKIHNLSYQFWKYAWDFDESNPDYLSLKSKINEIAFANESKEKTDNGYFTYSYNFNALSNSQNKGGKPSYENQNNPGYSNNLLPQNNHIPDSKKPNPTGKKPQNGSDNIYSNNRKYPLHPKASQLLEDIFLNPLSSISQRYRRLRLSGYYGNKLKNSLIYQRCILQRKIITNKYRITLFDLTQKGRMVLRDMGHKVKDSKEGIIHKFWKEKIAEHYRNKGFEVLVEEYINGRPDIIVKDNKRKITVEIETGKSDFIGNIQRALKARFDEVICVATGKKVEERIREELIQEKIDNQKVKIKSVLSYNLN